MNTGFVLSSWAICLTDTQEVKTNIIYNKSNLHLGIWLWCLGEALKSQVLSSGSFLSGVLNVWDRLGSLVKFVHFFGPYTHSQKHRLTPYEINLCVPLLLLHHRTFTPWANWSVEMNPGVSECECTIPWCPIQAVFSLDSLWSWSGWVISTQSLFLVIILYCIVMGHLV